MKEIGSVTLARFPIKISAIFLSFPGAYLDPDGFERDTEEDYEQRYLHLSQMGGMYKLDAVLDRQSGAALKTAIDGLAKRLGADDIRAPKQPG